MGKLQAVPQTVSQAGGVVRMSQVPLDDCASYIGLLLAERTHQNGAGAENAEHKVKRLRTERGDPPLSDVIMR